MGDSAKPRRHFKSLDFPGYWGIIWFGRLSRLSESSDNVSIYVYAGKLTGPGKNSYALPLEHKRVNLPIGQFPFLYIGAVLKDGYLISPKELPNNSQHTQNISLDISKDKTSSFTREAKDNAEYLVPMKYQWEFYNESQADSCLLGIHYNNNPHGIIIPCAEILRFFYCYSSNLAKIMTSDRILDPGRWLYDLNESNFDEQTGTVTLKPRLTVSELSRVFLACFISGSFDINRAKQIPKQIAVSSRTDPERPFVAFPPFDGPCTLLADYHIHEGSTSSQIVITRIISAVVTINFSAITFSTTCSGEKGTGKRKTKDWTKIIVSNPSDQAIRLNPGAVNHELGSEIIFDDDLGKRFPVFSDIAQIPIKQKNSSGNGGPAITTINHPEGSTSDKGSADSTLHKITILPRDSGFDSNKIGETAFGRIQKALMLIKSASLATVTFMELTTEIQKYEASEIAYNLPKRNHKEPWAYINKIKEQRRRFIVAEVCKDLSTRYLVEFEQRSSGECATLILWDSDTDKVPEDDILIAVEECITNNACYLESQAFEHSWSKLKHSWTKNEHLKPEHFLDRIFSAESLLSGI